MSFAERQGSKGVHFCVRRCYLLSGSVKAGADVRVSVRGGVVDVQVRETVIGTVIRITANLEPAPLCNLSDYSKK